VEQIKTVIETVVSRFDDINSCIERGEQIPAGFTENFVRFDLHEDPYSRIK
jgi:hypothetical protein